MVQTLGEEEFLYAIITLILDKYTEKLQKGHTTEADSLSEFCLTVSNQFSPLSEFKSLISLMESLLDLPNEKPDDEDAMATDCNSLFDPASHSNTQLRQFKLASLNFASRLLSSKGFLAKLLSSSYTYSEYEATMEQHYLKMTEVLLKLVTTLGQYSAQYSASIDASPAISKFWRGLLKLTYDVLDQVNSLLPLSSFVNIVARLLIHEDFIVRRKVMLLFNEKVSNVLKENISTEEEARVVGMVKNLAAIVNDEEGLSADDDDNAVGKQTALLCISTLTQQFGRNYQTELVEVVSAVIGKGALLHPNVQVKASSIVCLTFMM